MPRRSSAVSYTHLDVYKRQVKHSVAFYERNALRVRDELETLARNEAAAIPANTVQPLGDPADGAQRFAAYQCSRR